jgi:hypothetical protein
MKFVCWSVKAQGFAGALVELQGDLIEVRLRVARQIGAVCSQYSFAMSDGLIAGEPLIRTLHARHIGGEDHRCVEIRRRSRLVKGGLPRAD